MQSDVTLRLFDDSSNSIIVPLFDGYNISLNFAFTDIQDFAVKGSFSNTFRSPMTDDMVTFFGAIFNANNVGWFDPRRKIRAELAVDTIPQAIGHIQVTDIVESGTGINEIEIQFYGETPDLARDCGDDNLSDLTGLSALNHVLTYDNTQDDALNSGNTLYFLIDKGQNFSEQGEVGTRPIFDSDNPLYPSDLTPAVPARWIWDNIFSDKGFVIESPSNFPDTLDDLYVPWYLGTISPISTDAPDAENFSLFLDTGDTFTDSPNSPPSPTAFTTLTEEFDNGGNVLANVFTAPLTGYYSFRIYANVLKQSGTVAIVSLSLRTGSTAPFYEPTLFQSPFVSLTNNVVPVQMYYETTVFLEAGTDVTPYYTISGGNVLFGDSATPDPTDGTGWDMYNLANVLYGQTVDMVANAPIMRQIDFLRSIASMYNLVFVPDRNVPKKIRVEPITDYLQSGATVDWTNKLDLNKDRRLTPTTSLQKKELLWTYKEDGDFLNKLYKEQGNRIFGRLSNEDNTYFDNLQSDFSTGSLKVELQFSPTPCRNIPGTATPVPLFIDDQGRTMKANPRILYWATTQGSIQMFDDDTETVIDSSGRILSHFSAIDLANELPGVGTFDLNFGQETIPPELQQTFGQPYFTLFNVYWRDYMRELYDQTSRIYTGHFALSTSDILNFSFADRIWIKDSYWRILEINNFGVGQDNTTEVKLLKILSTTAECTSTPLSSNANGTVTFQDSDGNPVTPSETCCELYGYTWDSVTNTCRWSSPARGTVSNRRQTSSILSNSSVRAGNFGSYLGGDRITMGAGNPGSVAFGEGHTITENLGGGLAVFGRNALVDYAGIHFGGGYIDEDLATVNGRAQASIFVLSGVGTFVSIGDVVELQINGLDRIELPNNSCWASTLNVSFIEYNLAGGTLNDYGQQVYEFAMYKSGSTAGVTSATIAPMHEDTSFNAHLQLDFDTTTDTTQHRLRIKSVASASLPTGEVQFTAVLKCSRVRNN